MYYKYHKDGTNPRFDDPDVVFVFGSNLSGIHGSGAALQAVNKFGAEWGKGFGPQGRSFAIPTKDWSVKFALDINDIKTYVNNFTDYALKEPDKKFFITRVGCGLAGFKDEDIAPLFKHCLPHNVDFPEPWWKYLE